MRDVETGVCIDDLGSKPGKKRETRCGTVARTLRGIVIISLLVAFPLEGEVGEAARAYAGSIRGSSEPDQSVRNCRGFDFSGQISDGFFVKHGGNKVRVRIPVDYLLFPEVGSTFTQKGDGEANFYFHRDTLKPYPRHEMLGKIIAGKEEWIGFLVTNLIEVNDIAKKYANIFSGRDTNSTEAPFPERKISEDLYQVQFRTTWQQKTLFLGRRDMSVTDVISCTVPKPDNYPHCEQITQVAGYDVKISYPLDQLHNWKSIKQNVRNLMECQTQ